MCTVSICTYCLSIAKLDERNIVNFDDGQIPEKLFSKDWRKT